MSKYDWEAIARDYRAGVLSIRNLAAKHGVPESTVRTKAKTEGWQRDLSDSVRRATRAKLSRDASRIDAAQLDEKEIIEGASSEAAGLIMRHRQGIARWRVISERLASTLESVEVDASNHGEFARSLNAGIDALGKAIKLERQAYNMDDEKPDEGMTFEQLMETVAPNEDELSGDDR